MAIGEWTRTRYEMREQFERRAYDILMHDIARTGITEGHRIATLADTYNIPVAPHVGGGWDPVGGGDCRVVGVVSETS